MEIKDLQQIYMALTKEQKAVVQEKFKEIWESPEMTKNQVWGIAYLLLYQET